MIATIVNSNELLKTVIAAFAAGVLVTFTFSLGLLGAIRMAEASREARRVHAGLFGALAVAGMLATAAAIVFGIIVMTSK